MKMKRILTLGFGFLLAAIFLSACGAESEPPEIPVEPGIIQDKIEQADIPVNDSIPQKVNIENEWGVGVANWDEETEVPTWIAVYGSNEPGTGYNRASYKNITLDIGYIGEKEATVEGFYYFHSYENTAGPEYKILYPAQAEGIAGRTFFLYNAEEWGDMAGNIKYTPKELASEPADTTQIAAMEKSEGGRNITQSELLAIFTLNDGGDNYLSLMRYENTDNGLFKIVLYDDMNNYYTKDYPCEFMGGDDAPTWRADLFDHPGHWNLLFAGKVNEEIFLVTTWAAPEGRFIVPLIARDGQLIEVELPESFFNELNF